MYHMDDLAIFGSMNSASKWLHVCTYSENRADSPHCCGSKAHGWVCTLLHRLWRDHIDCVRFVSLLAVAEGAATRRSSWLTGTPGTVSSVLSLPHYNYYYTISAKMYGLTLWIQWKKIYYISQDSYALTIYQSDSWTHHSSLTFGDSREPMG